MSTYRFEDMPHSFTGSISQLMLASAQQRANAIREAAAIRAQQENQQAQTIANMGQSIGNTVAGIPGQLAKEREAAQLAQERSQRMAMNQFTIDDRAQQQQARQVFSDAVARGGEPDQSMQPVGPPSPDQPQTGAMPQLSNDQLPKMPQILKPNGLFDVGETTKVLAMHGLAGNSDELMKHLDQHNESLLKFQQADAARNIAKNDAYARAAASWQAAEKLGVTPEAAGMIFSASLKASGLPADEIDQSIAKLVQLDPETRKAAIGEMIRRYSKPDEVLADGARRIHPLTGETIAENPKDKPGYTINGQRFDGDGKPVGAVVPKQETPKADEPLDRQLLRAIASGDKTKVEQISKSWAIEAEAKRDPQAVAQLRELRNITAQAAQARLDDLDVGSDKNQAKFEQQYRGVLKSTLSSRSGGLGLEAGKVDQAQHLLALFNDNRDANGNFNLTGPMQLEAAIGLARLLSPTGVAQEGIINALSQKTAKGDLAGAITYLTGTPQTGNTQAVLKSLRDSIQRQGEVAVGNRATYLDQIRGMAPTDLSDDRKTKVEAGLEMNTLPPLDSPRRGATGTVDGAPAVWDYRQGKWAWWRK